MAQDTARHTTHRVSVVVPVYNVERYLAQCLDSIRSSLGRALEVAVVDDGSTDASAEIARERIAAAANDPAAPDFKLIRKENGGYGAAVNLGFAQTDGAYVGIVEPDDYLDGDQFGELARIAAATGEPDIVKACYQRVWMPDTPEQRIWRSLLTHRGVRTWERGCTDLGESPQLVRWHPSVWSAVYRRDFLDATGTRFIEFPGAGWVDNPFVMRAFCQAERVAFTDSAWYRYREDRPGSSTVTKAADLSLIRWGQMADEVARSRFAEDEGVLAVLYGIGFRYVTAVWDTPAYEGRVRELARGVLAAMRPGIALAIPDLSPAVKRRYLEETGYAGEVGGAAAYRRALLAELAWSWRENGFWFACERAGLHRHPSPAAARPGA